MRFRQLKINTIYERQLQKSAKFFEKIESVSLVGGFRLDPELNVTQLTPQARNIFNLKSHHQYAFDDIADKLGEAHKSIKENLVRILEDENSIDLELQLDHSSEQKQWLRMIAVPVIEHEKVIELIVVIQDISQKKRSEYLIDLKENYDALTGLPNRNYFRDRVNGALESAAKEQQQVALLILDIDNFSNINENLSQSVGDYLLVQFADRVQSTLGESALLSRLSGDEFALLLTDVRSYASAYTIAEDILKVTSLPFELAGEQVFVGTSIGIAMYPDDSNNRESLMRNANQAMHDVKSSGKNNWRFFTKSMQSASEKRHSIHNRLSKALEQGDIKPYYQPIFDVFSMELVGCEALARWQLEDGSFISPAEFIPVAEESELINRIDFTIMEQSLEALERINQQFGQHLSVSINVSPRLFQANEKAKTGWFELIESRHPATPLSIEITERLLTGDFAETQEALQTLTELGAQISIDDFGTGFSSLSYLCRFPVHTIKIDQSFVQACCERAIERTLIETVIGMAKNLNLKVVAEGVEEQSQLDMLRQFRCQFAQGYLYSKPLSEPDFIAFVEQQQGKKRLAN